MQNTNAVKGKEFSKGAVCNAMVLKQYNSISNKWTTRHTSITYAKSQERKAFGNQQQYSSTDNREHFKAKCINLCLSSWHMHNLVTVDNFISITWRMRAHRAYRWTNLCSLTNDGSDFLWLRVKTMTQIFFSAYLIFLYCRIYYERETIINYIRLKMFMIYIQNFAKCYYSRWTYHRTELSKTQTCGMYPVTY
jgi:hypothetical protein